MRTKKSRNLSNPFIQELGGKMYLKPKANVIIAKGEAILDQTTGELKREGDVLIGRRRVVDRTEFAKVYFGEIATIYDLNKAAMNVLMYLAKTMDYEQKAFLNASTDYEKIGYKKRHTVNLGITNLINKDIIAIGHTTGYYWMNPLYICKGERFAKYTEWVTEERAASDDEKSKMWQVDEKKDRALKQIKDPQTGKDIMAQEDRPISAQEVELFKAKRILND